MFQVNKGAYRISEYKGIKKGDNPALKIVCLGNNAQQSNGVDTIAEFKKGEKIDFAIDVDSKKS